MNAIQDTIQSLASHLVQTWPRYQMAKGTFVATTARLGEIGDQSASSANAKARTDAIADCQWYSTDLQTTASVLSALCLSQMGKDQ